jgi:hypothetical protein
MGADARIRDIRKPVKLNLVCYHCGKQIDLANPLKDHRNCCTHFDPYPYEVKVNYNFENVEER